MYFAYIPMTQSSKADRGLYVQVRTAALLASQRYAPMFNPFDTRAASLQDPARSMYAITPDDAADLPYVATALYTETAGTVAFVSVAGDTCTVAVGDYSILPVGVRRVLATGTTALGLHAFMVG